MKVLITTNTTADLIIDVQGYFTPGTEGGSFTPQDNRRIWDSRNSAGGALAPREEREIRITGAQSIPEDAGSVAMTVTALNWTGSGSLAVYNSDNPGGANGTSNVAFAGPYQVPRQTTSIVQASYGGTITLKNLSTTGSTHVLLNTQGWFSQPDEVDIDIPSEADRVASEMREALASNPQDSVEDEALPAVTPYDTHDLVFSTAATDTRTATLPLPTGCSVQDPVALRLSCDFGPVVISPVAVTADGNTVDVTADLDNNGLRISPQTPEFDGFVTAYLTQATDSDLVDDIAETLSDLVGGNGPNLKTQEQLDAEEDELNGDTETTEPPPDTTPNTEAAPAPSPTEQPTANAMALRAAFVTVPSNYIYCKTHTTARCKPAGRHDYCTSSPDTAKYARGTASFKGPCARHDMGIARIATYNLSLTSKRTQRATEDRNLKSNMRQNCLYALRGYGGYLQSCYSRASTYYWVVSRTTNGWNGR